MVGRALHAGVRGLAGEAALAEGAGGAGRAEAVRERLEARPAHAVLEGRPAGREQRAGVGRTGEAAEVRGRVLEGVGRALGAEAGAVAAAELAGGTGAAHVRRVALVPEAAHAVVAVDAPRERGVEAVEQQELVRGAAVGGEVAGAALEVALDEEVSGGAEHTRCQRTPSAACTAGRRCS